MRDERLFVASRGRGFGDVRRALAREFTVTPDAVEQGARAYLDTFDWRFLRAGLELDVAQGTVTLRDATTAEVLATGALRGLEPGSAQLGLPTPDAIAGRRAYARDLTPATLRERALAVAGPRALLEVARARTTAREAAVHGEANRLVARLRAEDAVVRSRGAVRTVRILFVEPVRDSRRTRTALRNALARAGYRPWTGSGYDRVLAATGARPYAYRRARVETDASGPLGVAVAGVFRNLLAVMERNEPGLVSDLDPEFLHDFRVALRRTRTALSEFGGVLPAEDTRAFRSGFAALAGPTGSVRDLDVHVGRRAEYAAWVPVAYRSGIAPLFAALERERELRRGELLERLEDREYAALKRRWKRALAALADGRATGVAATEPALRAGRAAAAKRYARLRTIAASVDALDDDALHRARVQGKRLRYVLEFFAPALGEAMVPAAAAVERLQDALGVYHDATVFQILLANAARNAPENARAAVVHGAVVGALTARLDVRRAKARRRAADRLAAMTDGKGERLFRRLLED